MQNCLTKTTVKILQTLLISPECLNYRIYGARQKILINKYLGIGSWKKVRTYLRKSSGYSQYSFGTRKISIGIRHVHVGITPASRRRAALRETSRTQLINLSSMRMSIKATPSSTMQVISFKMEKLSSNTFVCNKKKHSNYANFHA